MNEVRILVSGGCLCLAVAFWNLSSREDHSVVGHFVPVSSATPGNALRPVVGIVFSPQDCSGLIDALSYWNAPQKAGEVRVVGLLRGVSPGDEVIDKIVNGVGLEYPIRTVDSRALRTIRSSLGYRGGSVLVVFDTEGHVRLTAPLDELASFKRRDEIMSFVRTLKPRKVNDAN